MFVCDEECPNRSVPLFLYRSALATSLLSLISSTTGGLGKKCSFTHTCFPRMILVIKVLFCLVRTHVANLRMHQNERGALFQPFRGGGGGRPKTVLSFAWIFFSSSHLLFFLSATRKKKPLSSDLFCPTGGIVPRARLFLFSPQGGKKTRKNPWPMMFKQEAIFTFLLRGRLYPELFEWNLRTSQDLFHALSRRRRRRTLLLQRPRIRLLKKEVFRKKWGKTRRGRGIMGMDARTH